MGGGGGGSIEVLAVVGSDSSWVIGSGSVEGLGFRGGGGPIPAVMVTERERERRKGVAKFEDGYRATANNVKRI